MDGILQFVSVPYWQQEHKQAKQHYSLYACNMKSQCFLGFGCSQHLLPDKRWEVGLHDKLEIFQE